MNINLKYFYLKDKKCFAIISFSEFVFLNCNDLLESETIRLYRMYKEKTKYGPKTWTFFVDESFEIVRVHRLELEQTAFDSLDRYGVSIIVGSLFTSAIIGSYFKSAIYKYLYHGYKNKEHTPINILILINTICQHLICLFVVSLVIVGLVFDITFSAYIDEVWCSLPWYAGIFGGAYRTFGSLGIAIYRLLLIKRNDWVENIGKKRLVLIVAILGIVLSAGMTIGFGTGNGPGSRKQVTWNWMVGRNEKFREIEHEYSLITGTVAPDREYLAQLCLLGPLLGVVAEFCCYMIFFKHLHSHDKGLFNRKVLREDEFKRRKQINCMTFSGQFYGFIIECFTYIGLMYTFQKGSDITFRLVITISVWIEFGIVSVVEVLTSQNLKAHLPRIQFVR